MFRPFEVGGHLVCIADGIKAAKEGRKMPGVKLLHQESGSNSKAEWIMGHSLQAFSLLVHGPSGQAAAVPLVARIHEGLVYTNRDHRTILDKMVALLLEISGICDRKLLLVADAYYANQSVIRPLLKKGHHLVSRVKSTAVAYFPPEQPAVRKRGRPRVYGERAALKDLAKDPNFEASEGTMLTRNSPTSPSPTETPKKASSYFFYFSAVFGESSAPPGLAGT